MPNLNTPKKMIFDASIMKWREQTKADIKWAKDVIQSVRALEGDL